ncbi:MAG TPA: hypothetical protein VJ652_18970 [Noviherbaspirillum sp.]|nr:hypothetical protein [Noviherbaspirillum sp.]
MKMPLSLSALALAFACPAALAQSPGSMHDASGVQDSSGASGMQSEAGADLRQAGEPVAGLQPKTQGDVTYLCGGVGADEASYMKQQASGYDLMLTFAARNGAYLANVDVGIQDAKGNKVLQAKCDGPMLLVDLPKSGTYRIHADANGYRLDRTAKVTARHQKNSRVASVVMSWPQQVAEAPSTSETATGSSGGGSSDAGGRSGRGDDAGCAR